MNATPQPIFVVWAHSIMKMLPLGKIEIELIRGQRAVDLQKQALDKKSLTECSHIANKHGPLVMQFQDFLSGSLIILERNQKSVHGGYIRKCDQCPLQTTNTGQQLFKKA